MVPTLKDLFPNVVSIPVASGNSFILDEAVFIRMCTEMFENESSGKDFKFREDFKIAWAVFKSEIIEPNFSLH